MDFTTITVTEAGGVGTVTLNRPEVMNALSRDLRLEMASALRALQATARCIVITGAGRAFCSGQDLNDAGSLEAVDFERILTEEYVPLLRLITDSPVPTIAAVNGYALGFACTLVAACDFVIASERAEFGFPEVRIGVPTIQGSIRMPKKVGWQNAM